MANSYQPIKPKRIWVPQIRLWFLKNGTFGLFSLWTAQHADMVLQVQKQTPDHIQFRVIKWRYGDHIPPFMLELFPSFRIDGDTEVTLASVSTEADCITFELLESAYDATP